MINNNILQRFLYPTQEAFDDLELIMSETKQFTYRENRTVTNFETGAIMRSNKWA